jgi:hypothetical protein
VQRRARLGMWFPTRLDYQGGRASRGRVLSSQPGQEPTTTGGDSQSAAGSASLGYVTRAASGHGIAA